MVKIVFSFDDGRKDNYRIVKEILEPLDIPATFNITTGYINKDISDKDKPGPHDPMSVEEINEIWSNKLFEVAGHGYVHNNNVENLLHGANMLRKQYNHENYVMGIASPCSKFDLSSLSNVMPQFIENNIVYLRISNDYKNMSFIKKWIKKVNRIFHIPFIFYWTNSDSIMANKMQFLLYSIPILRDTKLNEVKMLLKRLEKEQEDKICILMFHSILKRNERFYKDLFSWDYYTFKKLCFFLNEERLKNKIELCTTMDLYKL